MGSSAATIFSRSLASALADLGLRHAVLSPGSRNAPLSLAFSAEPRIDALVLHDERSAAFQALGMARATGRAVALVSTSGTAPAHYHPAVLEAAAARVPLIALTADRPPELRSSGAPQTVDQDRLFGGAVKWFHDTGVPDDATAPSSAALALRIWAAAMDTPAGPVHVNVPFREPLVDPAPSLAGVDAREGSAPRTPRYRPSLPVPSREDVAELHGLLHGRDAVVVVGGHPAPGLAAAVEAFVGASGIPLLADPQCRPATEATIDHADLLVSAGILERLRPDVVLRVGAIPTSKRIWRWLEATDTDQVYVDTGQWRDPLGSTTIAFRADPTATLLRLAGDVERSSGSWTEAWTEANALAGKAVTAALRAEAFPNEPGIARTAFTAAPENGILFVGSSMPIRDIDTFAAPARSDLTVLANRGANGIDGLLSSAMGAAVATARPVVALSGDVGILHDAAALGTIARLGPHIVVVAVNNDGGGIFHHLPQAQADLVPPDRFEELFAAPHGQSMAAIASGYGIDAVRTDDRDELTSIVAGVGGGPRLVEVVTDRRRNVDVHRRLRAAVRDAMAGA